MAFNYSGLSRLEVRSSLLIFASLRFILSPVNLPEPMWNQVRGWSLRPWPYLAAFITLLLARWSADIFSYLNRGQPSDAFALVISSFLFGGLTALLFWSVVRIGRKFAKPKGGGPGQQLFLDFSLPLAQGIRLHIGRAGRGTSGGVSKYVREKTHP